MRLRRFLMRASDPPYVTTGECAVNTRVNQRRAKNMSETITIADLDRDASDEPAGFVAGAGSS